MKRRSFIFSFAGVVAGVATVTIGTIWPGMIIGGVGVLFFATLLIAITASNSWSRVQSGRWRYVMGLLISTAAYLVGLFAFSVVGGYSPDVLGVPPSSDISRFGVDVAIGLLASTVASALCIEL